MITFMVRVLAFSMVLVGAGNSINETPTAEQTDTHGLTCADDYEKGSADYARLQFEMSIGTLAC